MKTPLARNLATARQRLGSFRHPGVVVVLETVTALVACVWGGFVALPGHRSFTHALYDGFILERETPWGLYFLTLGLVHAWVVYTGSREARARSGVVVAFSFAQLVYLQVAGSPQLVPAPLVYGMLGVLLPVGCIVWHVAHGFAEDFQQWAAPVRAGLRDQASDGGDGRCEDGLGVVGRFEDPA